MIFPSLPALWRIGQSKSSPQEVQSCKQKSFGSIFELLRAKRETLQTKRGIGYWWRKDQVNCEFKFRESRAINPNKTTIDLEVGF